MPSATQQLLDTWEAVLPLSPAGQALGLGAAMRPDLSTQDLGDRSVGERDSVLLRLRAAMFGPTVTAVSCCPECGERVELRFTVDDVQSDERPDGDKGELVVEQDGWSVTSRLPTGHDLAYIEGATSEQDAVAELWRRCALDVRLEGHPRSADEVPDSVRATMADRFAVTDPQAQVQIRLCCPVCDATWEQDFDIASFLWTEVDTWARHLLADVHVLARGYGWDESHILALSPLRRRAYLEMLAT